MGFQPVSPETDLRFRRNIMGQKECLLHAFDDDRLDGFHLIPMGVKYELIMHLE